VLERDSDRKDGYAEMVEVIREYLAARYRISTRDLTSSELLRRLEQNAPDDEVVLLGSIATPKYLAILEPIFGDRLRVPRDFIGRGDMSRGALLLRAVRAASLGR